MRKQGKKHSLKALSLFILKGLSCFCFAFVLALAGRELINYGLFSLVFLMLSIGWAFFYLVRPLGFVGILAVWFLLSLMAIGLRWYVMTAYGS